MQPSPLQTFFQAPIRFMGHIYQKKYHLRYVHARKLFLFDMLLVLGTLLLIVATVCWRTYDPTIVDYILLNVTVTDTQDKPLSRIASGETVRYTVTFENTSEATMTRPQLLVQTPAYFSITDMDADSSVYDDATHTFILPDIAPGARDSIYIDGVYFGTPHVSEDVLVTLSYIQDGRTVIESRHARIISTLRDAILTGEITMTDTVRGNGTYPISLQLANTGDIVLENISIPSYASIGEIVWEGGTNTVTSLTAASSVTLSGTLRTNIPVSLSEATVAITPALIIDGDTVPQAAITQSVQVVHPSIALRDLRWGQDATAPGQVVTLSGNIQNTGSATLTDIQLTVPTDSGIVANGTPAVITDTLLPGATTEFVISIPIRNNPIGGSDLVLRLSPTVTAQAPGGTDPVRSTAESPSLAIGTALNLSAHSRYYTAEGDQLGRGSLPPMVGKETKYWVLVDIQNTTSRVTNAAFSATLGPYVTWTGRASVTLGNEPTYQASSGQITWGWPSIPPGQTVGIYMELAITPPEGSAGTIPTLLQHVTISGTDDYIGTPLSRYLPRVTADLALDPIGQAKGVVIQ